MRIGFDIDGVLFPWDETARDALVARFGIVRPGPSTEWSYLKKAITPEQWRWLWSPEGQDWSFGRFDVYPGASEAVLAILKAGHEVHFVTHRDPRRASAHTAAYLARHFKAHPWAGVHVLQTGTPKHALMEWDVFVDDKPSTVFEMLTHTGAQVFSPVRAWNDTLEELESPRLVRYIDPACVAEWVLER